MSAFIFGRDVILLSLFLFNKFVWYLISVLLCFFLCEISFPECWSLIQLAFPSSLSALFCCFCEVFRNTAACFLGFPGSFPFIFAAPSVSFVTVFLVLLSFAGLSPTRDRWLLNSEFLRAALKGLNPLDLLNVVSHACLYGPGQTPSQFQLLFSFSMPLFLMNPYDSLRDFQSQTYQTPYCSPNGGLGTLGDLPLVSGDSWKYHLT